MEGRGEKEKGLGYKGEGERMHGSLSRPHGHASLSRPRGYGTICKTESVYTSYRGAYIRKPYSHSPALYHGL